MKNLTLCIACLFCCITFLNAQNAQCILDPSTGTTTSPNGGDCVNSIFTAVPFLRITPDARSGAMGDAGLAISPDANAMHLNPSKLVFAEDQLGISVTYTPWLRALGLTDVYLAYLSGYTQISDDQAIGIGLRYFSLGEISFTDENGTPTGVGRPNEFEVALSYARKLTDKFSAALTAKYIYSNLAAGQQIGVTEINPGNAGAADVSLTYKTPLEGVGSGSDLSVALAITNIGSKITYTQSINKDYLPANLGVGAAWGIEIDDYNSFTIAADVNKLMVPTPCVGDASICDTSGEVDVPDYKEQGIVSSIFSSFGDAPEGFSEELRELMFSVGLEYWYDKQFAVRAGYYGEHSTKGNRKYFTVGLGLKYNIFGLNFSYLVPTTNQRNPLDNTLRFSLLFDLAAFQSAE